jgi:HAD superfamily hydrolase (TIGR01509 family)
VTGEHRGLISLDIGGTLGYAYGPGLTARLAGLSPLGPAKARRVMRDLLHIAPRISEAVVDRVCNALGIAPSDFPRSLPATQLEPFPGTIEALRELSQSATLVTLSNVVCTEADPDHLLRLFSPWVSAYFPSCRTGYAKPDPRAFLAVAKAYGVHPSQIVHVGDDWECDVQGAIDAGLSAVWLSHGRTIPDPHLIVEHGVQVAGDLPDAVRHAQHLLTRRQS